MPLAVTESDGAVVFWQTCWLLLLGWLLIAVLLLIVAITAVLVLDLQPELLFTASA